MLSERKDCKGDNDIVRQNVKGVKVRTGVPLRRTNRLGRSCNAQLVPRTVYRTYLSIHHSWGNCTYTMMQCGVNKRFMKIPHDACMVYRLYGKTYKAGYRTLCSNSYWKSSGRYKIVAVSEDCPAYPDIWFARSGACSVCRQLTMFTHQRWRIQNSLAEVSWWTHQIWW